MSKAVKIFWIIFLILFSIVLVFLIYATITDYKPKERIILYSNPKAPYLTDSVFTLMTWNIGYCGMSKQMDFFYDGGTQTRLSKDITLQNVDGIKQFISSHSDSLDFILLQEVDTNAKRTYHINEFKILKQSIGVFRCFFATNYNVKFIPVPLKSPYGKVIAGLVSCSRYEPYEVVRYSFPGNFAWPKGLFMLDRCFSVMRFHLKDGKDFLVINTHNSAFDDGSLRRKQMAFLKDFITSEYNKGNYILVGGDWNQVPPHYNPKYTDFVKDSVYLGVPDTLLPQWQWVYDPSMPTNRNADQKYDKSKTPTKIIDFYLLSPNIELEYIKTEDLNFEYSDHQPVFMRIKLKGV